MNIRAYTQLLMDRPIRKGAGGHYISPGGYEFTFADGKTYRFDFNESSGTVSNDSRIVNFELRNFDTSLRPDGTTEDAFYRSFFESAHHPVTRINEFFVYTGEYDEPEIHVKAVNSFLLELVDDTGSICYKNDVSKNVLSNIEI